MKRCGCLAISECTSGRLAIECTPKWQNKVQITAVGNLGKKPGYNTRTWQKRGKMPYVEYGQGGGSDLRYGITLKRGAKGTAVSQLQKDLVKLGYSVGATGQTVVLVLQLKML